MIPGFEIVSPGAPRITRLVVDVYPHEVEAAPSSAAPEGVRADVWRDFHVVWCIAEKLRKAGIPVTPLTGQLMEGTLTYFDLVDSGARRYVWEGWR